MRDRRGHLRADPVPWLMESADPSLKHILLTELLDRPSGSAEVVKAKSELMSAGPVAAMLSTQKEGGHWGREEDYYQRSKYKGTVWNTIVLAELGAGLPDPRIRRLGEYILRWPRREDGGFSYKGGPQEKHKPALPCLTANMVWALCRFGLGNDSRLDSSVDMLIDPFRGEVYKGTLGKCARCRSGDVKTLKALNALPQERMSGEVRERREELAERIMSTSLPKDRGALPPARPEWGQLAFPLMWDTDLLEILDVLSPVVDWDERMRPALDIVLAKQDDGGRWKLERSWNGRTLVRFDRVGKPSPWVTLKALTMLKHLPEPG